MSKVTPLISAGIRIQIQPTSGDPRDEGECGLRVPVQVGLIHSLHSMEELQVVWIREERDYREHWLPKDFKRKRVAQNLRIFPGDQEIRSHCDRGKVRGKGPSDKGEPEVSG